MSSTSGAAQGASPWGHEPVPSGVFPAPEAVGGRRLAQRRAAEHRLGDLGARPAPPTRLLPLGPLPHQGLRTALLAVLVLYGARWATGMYSAVVYLARPGRPTPESWLAVGADALDELFVGAVVVWAALLFASSRGVRPRQLGLRLPRTGADWWGEAVAGGASVLAIALGFLAADLVASVTGSGAVSYPMAPSAADDVSGAIGDLMAGPTEEVVLLGVVVALLRRAGRPWPWVVVFDVVLRVSFHAYYGWPAVGLVVWTAAVLLLHARTGRLLGIVVAHSLWDLSQTLGDVLRGLDPAGLLLGVSVLLVAAGLGTRALSASPVRLREQRAAWVRWSAPRRAVLVPAALAVAVVDAALLDAVGPALPVMGGALLVLVLVVRAVAVGVHARGLRLDETRGGLAAATLLAVHATITVTALVS